MDNKTWSARFSMVFAAVVASVLLLYILDAERLGAVVSDRIWGLFGLAIGIVLGIPLPTPWSKLPEEERRSTPER
jgi:hypothetical protein